MKLLLHCCCAPCSLSCIGSLREKGIEPELFWYNPNIHPYTEYKSRRDCLASFAANENIKLEMSDEYRLQTFLNEVFPDTERRCEKCYALRLEKTASVAAQKGFNAFSTSLLISPYQDHDAIKRIGGQAAAKYGVEFYYSDFRPFFREGQAAARAKEFYMQKYCGCIFSEEERYAKKSFPRSRIDTDEESGNSFTNSYHNTEDIDLNHKNRTPQPCGSAALRETFPEINPVFERLVLLTGSEGLEKLSRTKALVFGAGGVGSWAAEALVRSGIGKIGIIDNDTVCASNINRQAEATTLTLGLPKASALKKHLQEINGECEITSWDELFCRDNAHHFGIESADFVIDAIDTLNHKLDLIETVCSAGVTLFSSMGMALKMDPSQIKIASVWDTHGCPLARLVRQGLRKRGFSGDFTVVYSSEQFPAQTASQPENEEPPKSPGQKRVNGSVVTVTASAGFMLASLVLRKVINNI